MWKRERDGESNLDRDFLQSVLQNFYLVKTPHWLTYCIHMEIQVL